MMWLLGAGLFLAGMALGAVLEGRSRQRDHQAELDALAEVVVGLNQQLDAALLDDQLGVGA